MRNHGHAPTAGPATPPNGEHCIAQLGQAMHRHPTSCQRRCGPQRRRHKSQDSSPRSRRAWARRLRTVASPFPCTCRRPRLVRRNAAYLGGCPQERPHRPCFDHIRRGHQRCRKRWPCATSLRVLERTLEHRSYADRQRRRGKRVSAVLAPTLQAPPLLKATLARLHLERPARRRHSFAHRHSD